MLDQLAGERIEIPMVIGGAEVTTGNIYEAVMPHETKHVLGDVPRRGEEARQASRASELPFEPLPELEQCVARRAVKRQSDDGGA